MGPPGAAASRKERSGLRKGRRGCPRTGSQRARPKGIAGRSDRRPPTHPPQAEAPPGSRGNEQRSACRSHGGAPPPPSPSALPEGRPPEEQGAGRSSAEPPGRPGRGRALAATRQERCGRSSGDPRPGRDPDLPPPDAPPLQGHRGRPRGRQSEATQALPPPEPPNRSPPSRRDPATGSAEGQVARLRPSEAGRLLSAAFRDAEAVTWLGPRGRPRGEAGASGHRSRVAP